MTVLGVRYALAIALLTGLARFVPYIGPLLTNLITFVVAVFQSSNYFGLNQVYFAIIVVVIVIFVDQVFDNYISPRMFGQRLGIHPAAVLVAALILAQFIGFIGLVLAAPVLASLQLISRYSLRKIFDLDPWPEPESEPPPAVYPWQRLANFWGKKITQWRQRSKDDQQNE
jgi:predicted PurR-regulated permease PerM